MRILAALICAIVLCSNVNAGPIDGKKLFRSYEVQLMKFSPDTAHLLTVALEDGSQNLYLTNLDKDHRMDILKLGADSGKKILGFDWVDNHSFILHFEDRGIRGQGLLKFNPDGEQYSRKYQNFVTEGELVSYLESDKDTVLFSRDDPDTKGIDHQLYRLTTEQLVNGDFSKAVSLNQGLDKVVTFGFDDHTQKLWAFTLDDDKLTIYARHIEQEQWKAYGDIARMDHEFKPVAFINEKTVVVLSNEVTDKKALLEFDLATQKYGKVLYEHPKYDLIAAQMNTDGATVRRVSYFDHGRLLTEHFNRDDKKLHAMIAEALPGKQFFIVDEKPGFDDKLVLAFASDDPGAYYFYDHSAKELRNVGERLSGLNKKDLTKSEALIVNGEDGLPIEAILTRSNNPNGVLLVMPHGGPIGVQETQLFNRQTQYLASRGYSVLQVNFRGSSGYGKRFEQKGVGELGRNIESDITRAVKHVRSRYQFDKMCAMGSSYGGYSALMLAMQYPQDYQCAVGAYGIYDLPFLYNASNFDLTEGMQKAIERVVGKDREQLKAVSPFYMVEKLKVPVLLIAGKKDEIAWFEHSNRLKYRMKQLGVDFEHYFYPYAGHGHSSYSGDRHEMAAVDEFLRRRLNLPTVTDPDEQQLLAAEYLLLANAWNEGILGDDKAKALDWYKKAAALGEGLAMFNVGSFYHYGVVVEKDIEQAVIWYKKASDKGLFMASRGVAEIYKNGDLGQPDHVQSVSFFKKALKQGWERARLDVALAECNGKGTKQNFDSCIERLSVESKDEEYVKRRWNILGELFWHENLTPQHRQSLIDLSGQIIGYDVRMVPIRIQNWGTYNYYRKSTSGKRYRVYEHDDTSAEFDATERNAYFGVRLVTDSEPLDGVVSLVSTRWRIPQVENCKVTGFEYQYELDFPKMMKGAGVYYIRDIDNDWERVAFDWRIEVQDMQGNKVFDKVFKPEEPNCK